MTKTLTKYWPQWLATAIALAVAFFAFRDHNSSRIHTDEDLAAFLKDVYLDDSEESDEEETNYFILAE